MHLEAFKYAVRSRQNVYCKGHELGEFVSNPMDCKLFYWCGENDEAVTASCPPNMLFNPLTKLCDNPKNVKCNTGLTSTTNNPIIMSLTTTSSPETTTTEAPSRAEQYCYNLYDIERNTYALVFLPHPRNCQLYFMCYQGQALLQACGSKLHWNTKLVKCDLPSNAECFGSELEEVEGGDVEVLPSLDENICGNVYGIKCPLYGEHIFPNVKRCDSFIYCVKGQAVLQSCPFYTVFDVESARCIWRLKATCVKDLNIKYR